MTDITELAQSLKAAAEKLGGAQWQTRKGFSGIEVIVKGSLERLHGFTSFQPVAADLADTKTARAIALFSPANILALVEALEKAQQVDEELCKLLPPGVEYMDPPDGGDVTPLEGVRRMVADYRQLIAELESRTVKLPKPHAHLIWIQAGHAPDDYWDDVAVSHSEKDRCCDGSERYPVYARWEIEEMMSAAGIKVEAE